MAQTASAQAVVSGQGVLLPVKLGAFQGPELRWLARGKPSSPLQCCEEVQKHQLSHVSPMAAQENPLQWKATFTEVLFSSEPDPRAALAVVWEVLWLPWRQATQQLCFPMVL